MKKRYRKYTALCMAALFGITSLSGCQKQGGSNTDTEKQEGTSSGMETEAAKEGSQAMGRYVENEVSLPEMTSNLLDMVLLEDGTLRIARMTDSGGYEVDGTKDGGETWEKAYELTGEIMEKGDVIGAALSPTGTAFFITAVYGEEDSQYFYWSADETGSIKELSVSLPEEASAPYKNSIFKMDFAGNGCLWAEDYYSGVYEVNTETGELGKNLNSQEDFLYSFGCVGNDVFLMSKTDAYFYDPETAGTKEADQVLKSQVLSYIDEGMGFSYISPVVLSKGAEENLFFACRDGIYSFVPGGNVTEQLVDGSMTSLKAPSFGVISLEPAGDDSFYLYGVENSTEGKIYHYVYSPDIPATPSTELTLYTLNENSQLQQAIIQFQKENPDIYVNLQVGKSGDDAVTDSDALRTLNTDILAGKGPDILRLDELPVESYIEKGLLADISDVVEEIQSTDGFVGTFADTYRRDGGTYGIPAGFGIPMILGPEELIEGVSDLDTLVEAAAMAQNTLTDYQGLFGLMTPVMLAECLYDSSAASWQMEDGSLDTEKVTDFYTKLNQLYQMDSALREANEENIQYLRDNESVMREEVLLSGVNETFFTIKKHAVFCFGVVSGIHDYAGMTSACDYLDGFGITTLKGQSSNIYVPQNILGISSKSANVEAAKKFVSFMIGSDYQTDVFSSKGFPVSGKAFQNLIETDGEFNETVSVDKDGEWIDFEVKYPSAAWREKLQSMAEGLDTPAMVNSVVREAIIDQVNSCLDQEITPEQAAANAMQKINLYLSE